MYPITRQGSFSQKEIRVCFLHRNKPLVSPHSTFTVDFKGLQHPQCPRALREQKKTSEFCINRRAELGNLNLYPHHELHAKACKKNFILNCPKFDCFVTCLKTFHNCLPLSCLLIGWLIPDKAITGLQLNPLRIEFSVTQVLSD